MTLIEDLLPRHATGLRQFQPGFDTTGSRRGTIVIADSMQPNPAHFADRAIGNDRRVFNGKIALIIKTIGDPGANGVRRKLARVHADMERMLVVILFGAYLPQ